MPIYEYACRDCGRRFETLVRTGTVPECPACRSRALDKQLSVFATAGVTGQAEAAPAFAGGPCGSCGHPAGPGACSMPPAH